MGTRPAGLAALLAALDEHPFDRESLRERCFPTFFGYGDQTGIHEEIRAGILAPPARRASAALKRHPPLRAA